jgi:hypothetical protein
MRFAAPADTTAISLAAGEFPITDGFVDLPDDLGEGDLAGLAVHGFRAAPTADDAKKADAARKKADAEDAKAAKAADEPKA